MAFCLSAAPLQFMDEDESYYQPMLIVVKGRSLELSKERSIRVASMSRSAARPVGGYEVEGEAEEKAGPGDN